MIFLPIIALFALIGCAGNKPKDNYNKLLDTIERMDFLDIDYNDSLTKEINEASERITNPKTARDFFLKGFAATDFEQKRNHYKKAIELKPDYAEAYFYAGNAYLIDNYDESIKYYKKAIELKADYAAAYLQMGFAYEDKNNYDMALQSLEKSFELQPTYILLPYSIGNIYYDKQDYSKAIENYKKLISVPDFTIEAYEDIAQSYRELGDKEKAEEYRQKIHYEEKDFLGAWDGDFYLKKGNCEGWILDFETSCKSWALEYDSIIFKFSDETNLKAKIISTNKLKIYSSLNNYTYKVHKFEKPNHYKKKTFKDSRDGKIYAYVNIGKQTWMAENLNYYEKGSRCYGDVAENCEIFGRLYSWETAMNACPKGWHLPSGEEWDSLINYVETEDNCTYCAGIRLKYENSGWQLRNGTDNYGFAAIAGGLGGGIVSEIIGNEFNFAGTLGFWWSASALNDMAYGYSMANQYHSLDSYYSKFDIVNKSEAPKKQLRSVRCVM